MSSVIPYQVNQGLTPTLWDWPVFIFFSDFYKTCYLLPKNFRMLSFFLYEFLKNYPLFQKWKFWFWWKFELLRFLSSFINFISQLKTVSYVKLPNSAIGKIIFFEFFARFGHPKVENLVQDKVFIKSRLLKCGYFFSYFILLKYHKYMNIINLQGFFSKNS
jgi:hypothetical protein